MIGNDQPEYQTMQRIKEASIASGYYFKLESYKEYSDHTIIVIKNMGNAPIYYDAFISINGERNNLSLAQLNSGESQEYRFNKTFTDPQVSIESDHLVPGQNIQFQGNM